MESVSVRGRGTSVRAGLCILLATAATVLAGSGCAKPKPAAKVEVTQDGSAMVVRLSNNVTMKLVRLPAGKFVMGSAKTEKDRDDDEGPTRTVTISKPFYIAITEVTQEQYEGITNDNPSTFTGPANPVEEVTWNDAVEFCKELSRLTGKTFRLPTEAEWEYACRAGTRSVYCCGDRAEDLKKVGWFGFDPAAVKATRPVAGLHANAWGLYDMHGNVWEWCADWYGADYYSAAGNLQDPKGPASGSERIIRGGSWADEAEDCRSAYRQSQPPGYSDDDIGFRVVCEDSGQH